MSTYPFVHKCDRKWLKMRQNYLTATDIKSLLPVTKTGLKRKVTDMDRLKVYARKRVSLTEEDCYSYGAAARGHILEPYAIDALNYMLTVTESGIEMYHWDDVLIPKNPDKFQCLGFSPDATDMEQGTTLDYNDITMIAEVKSYAPEKHLVTAYTPKKLLEERWQIATAMATLPSIERAFLVLYNPKLFDEVVHVIEYGRDELADEINVIDEIEEEWINFVTIRRRDLFVSMLHSGDHMFSNYGPDEDEIKKSIESYKTINPVV